MLLLQAPYLSSIAASAREPEITIWTQDSFYTGRWPVIIFGNISEEIIQNNEPVLINVYAPNNTIYRTQEVPVLQNASYTYQMHMEEYDLPTGNYLIAVMYLNYKAESTFYFSEDPNRPRFYDLTVGNETYSIEYSIQNGRAEGISADSESKSITINITSNDYGELRLTLPKKLIKQVFGYEGYSAVFFDGEMMSENDAESFGCDSTVVTISFENGTKSIRLGIDPESSNREQPRGFRVTPYIKVQGDEFMLRTITNAESCDFTLVEDEKRLHVDIKSPANEEGYFQVAIPTMLLGGKFTVLVDNQTADFVILEGEREDDKGEDPEETIIAVNYERETRSIDIIGTKVIEFSVEKLNGINLSKSHAHTDDIHMAVSGDNVYVVWKDSTYDPLPFDAYFTRSTDGGATFDKPISLPTKGWSYNFKIATLGSNVVYLLWQDKDGELLFAKSEDAGRTLSVAKQVAKNGANPDIAASGNNVYFTWIDYGPPASYNGSSKSNIDVFFASSNDRGNTIEEPVNISNTALHSDNPRLAVHQNDAYLIWQEQKESEKWDYAIYFRKSNDAGKTFGDAFNLSGNSKSADFAGIDVGANGNIYAIWHEQMSGIENIIFKRSIDGGNTFEDPINLTELDSSSSSSFLHSLLTEGNNVYVMWRGTSADYGNSWISFTKSDDGGNTFTTPIILSDELGTESYPEMAASGDFIYVVWAKTPINTGDVGLGGFGDKIMFMRSKDGGNTFESATDVNNDEGFAAYPNVIASGNNVYLVWKHALMSGGSDALYTRSTDYGITFENGVSSLRQSSGIYNLHRDGRIYAVQYDIIGGQLVGADADYRSISMVIESQTQAGRGDGEIEVTLPRDLLDTVFEYHYPYTIFVDGIDRGYSIVNSSCEEHSIKVQFPAGSEKIEIVASDLPGTHTGPKGFEIRPSIAVNDEKFDLVVITNADSCDVSLVKDEKRLHVDIEGPNEKEDYYSAAGYFEITVPHRLLGGNYTVLINGNKISDFESKDIYPLVTDPDSKQDGNWTTISFAYEPEYVQSIDIVGTSVIPEFSSVLVGVVTAMSVAVVIIAARLRIMLGRRHDW